MNTVKFYKIVRDGEERRVKLVKVRVSQGKLPHGGPCRPTIAEVEDRMFASGFTRRRPVPPHHWLEQQAGYRQPSEAAQRRDRARRRTTLSGAQESVNNALHHADRLITKRAAA